MKKKGQFYLIAAIIIIILILSLSVVSNYLNRKSGVRIEDLKKELQIEGGKLAEYNFVNSEDKWIDFMGNYSDYAGGDFEIYYILGSGGSVSAYKYVGGAGDSYNVSEGSGLITIHVNGTDYDFDLNKGNNFYFVVTQQVGDDFYVVSG